jgi:hypothetical protein
MPYIPQDERPGLDRSPVGYVLPKDVGELTYVLSRIVWDYWRRGNGRFAQIADVRAALSSTLHEFNRQIADPYEDEKIRQNGGL